ncbi:hypothetical protein DCC85_21870 [Paenibacillus sp. CAA11]|nr:hypothetical protein DCC85_21870 [Paenibacillus sp. CAA11]
MFIPSKIGGALWTLAIGSRLPSTNLFANLYALGLIGSYAESSLGSESGRGPASGMLNPYEAGVYQNEP